MAGGALSQGEYIHKVHGGTSRLKHGEKGRSAVGRGRGFTQTAVSAPVRVARPTVTSCLASLGGTSGCVALGGAPQRWEVGAYFVRFTSHEERRTLPEAGRPVSSEKMAEFISRMSEEFGALGYREVGRIDQSNGRLEALVWYQTSTGLKGLIVTSRK